MRVKYVGLRPDYKDGMYGTGAWKKDQIKDVPVEVAVKMVKHVDQYQDAGLDEGVLVVPEGLKEGGPSLQELIETKALEMIERVKVRFLDAVLEAGEHTLEVVEALGETLTMEITAELAPADGDIVEKVIIEEKKEDDPEDTQEARDLVANMDKAQLDAYAFANFNGMKLHHNMTVENARAKVIGLIDQYGTE